MTLSKILTVPEFIAAARFVGGEYVMQASDVPNAPSKSSQIRTVEVFVGSTVQEALTLRLDGDEDAHIVVSGPGYANAYRSGSGRGDASRAGKGRGTAWRTGAGNGFAWRMGSGDGIAVKGGSGAGFAYRVGSGTGNAIHTGDGEGQAVRMGSGVGRAINHKKRNNEASLAGDVSGAGQVSLPTSAPVSEPARERTAG